MIKKVLPGLRLGLRNNCIEAPRKLKDSGIQRKRFRRFLQDRAKKKQNRRKQFPRRYFRFAQPAESLTNKGVRNFRAWI